MLRRFVATLLVIIAASTTTALVQREGSNTFTVYYEESFDDFCNPERGFFDQGAPLWLEDDKWLEVDRIQNLRSENMALIRLYFVIDEFRETPISSDALEIIQCNFDEARDAGVKVIPRFAYNFPSGDEYTEALDADLGTILLHLDQLAPILQSNSDVIAFLNLGFVGAWGEWHSSSNNHINGDRSVNDNTIAIVDKIMDTLPLNRFATMRYPAIKQDLYGTTEPLTLELAHDLSVQQARMGALNDCFLASKTDYGTYWPYETDADIQAYKDYLHTDNLYVPMSGETCNIGEDAEPFVGCDNALAELSYMRWDALHRYYLEDVIDLWKEEGCYDEIRRRLGYRFVLEEGSYSTSAVGADNSASTLQVSLQIRNDGFGKVFNPRTVELILRSIDDNGREHAFEVDEDPRYWLPGETASVYIELGSNQNEELLLPPAGDYEILLNLPDPEPSLRCDPRYSIRLANIDLWEEETGYNNLGATVTII